MILLLWDASALVKRYVPETGSEIVAELFAQVPATQMVTTFLGYAESWAVLVRQRNRNVFDEASYKMLTSALQNDVILDVDFGVLDVETGAILAGIVFVEKHNLNASDAAILVTYLRYAQLEAQVGNRYVLVASDARLLRAAQAEGLAVFNPETFSVADIAGLIVNLP